MPLTDSAIRAEFDAAPSLPVRSLAERLKTKGYVLEKEPFLDAIKRLCDVNSQDRTVSLKKS